MIFNRNIRPFLSHDDCHFWEDSFDVIRRGVINSARFEQYIRKFSVVGSSIIGRKNLKPVI